MSSVAARRALLGLINKPPVRSQHILPRPTPPTTLPKPPPPYPSPLATSSETTLEDFPHIPTSDPIIASLNYATDTELIDAILAEEPTPAPPTPARANRIAGRLPSGRRYVSPYNLDWKSSIDPAFAFLALRTRSTFGQFIEYIRPRVRQVYNALRPSGMHQLFASDVMIRSGDALVIRELLEIDGEQRKQFRTSATASMYEHIRPQLDSGRLAPLSGPTNRAIARALLAEGDIDSLPRIYDNMYETLEWNASQSAADFFAIILYMARHDRIDDALAMLAKPVRDGLISEAGRNRSDPSHPKAKTVLVQTMIIRASLQYKRYDRVQEAADDLISTIEGISSTPFITDLVLELCRTNIVGRKIDQITWTGDFLLRYARLNHSPPLPSAIVNAYIDNAPRSIAADWYAKLPIEHGPPSPQNIIRLAQFRPRKAFLTALLGDIAKLPETDFTAQRGHFLSGMVQAKERDAVIALYHEWKGTFDLSPKFVVAVVKLLTETKAITKEYDRQKQLICRHYDAFAQRHYPDSCVRALTLIQLYLLRREEHQIANLNLFKGITPDDPEVSRYIHQVVEEDPVEAYQLVSYLNDKAGIHLELPVQAIVNACLAGHWSALDKLHSAQEVSDGNGDVRQSSETRLIDTLRSLRAGRVDSALSSISLMEQEKDTIPTSLYRSAVIRALSVERIDLALRAWTLFHARLDTIPPENQVSVRLTGVSILRVLRSAISSDANDFEVDQGEYDKVMEIVDSSEWIEFGEKLLAIEVSNLEWDEKQQQEEMENRQKTRDLWGMVQESVEAVKAGREAIAGEGSHG